MRGTRAPAAIALLLGLLLLGLLARPAAAQVEFTPASLPDQIAVQSTAFSLTLPAAAHRTDTTGSMSYALSPTPPAGLSFDTSTRVLSGTPTAVAAAADYTLTATYTFTDSSTESATLTFSLEVKLIAFVDGTTAPHFPPLALPKKWTFTNSMCSSTSISRTLPTAVGQGTVTYTLDDDGDNTNTLMLPAGLSFTASPPTISGTPTAETAATTYTLTATDAASPTANTTSLTFELEVVDQKAILEAFYTATDGANWTTSTGWGATITVCPENLHGVTAAGGHVQQLALSFNALEGSIPAALGKLPELTHLRLRGNQLSGSIPAELSGLVSLIWLDLSRNQLSGSIPAELGELTELTQFLLHENQLSGSIPAELGELPELTHLRLYDNQLSGPIPAELGKLSKLRILTFYSNQLSGSIPAALGELTELTQLYLYDNQLSGRIPAALGKLTKLRYLYLYSNQLSGSVPDLSGLTTLQFLLLHDNQLTSVLDLSGLTKLQYLYLHDNQLTSVPDLSGLTSLQYLYLHDNQLTSVPDLSGLTTLTTVLLSHNQLTSAPSVPTGTRLWLYGNPALDLEELGQPAPVSLAVSPTAVREGAGTVAVEVTASLEYVADDTNAVTLEVAVEPGTAAADSDYTAAPTSVSLIIPANGTSVTATTQVTIVADTVSEEPETFRLALPASPSRYPDSVQPGDPTAESVTIYDSDWPWFESAAVNGTTLTLTYNENMDTGSVPAASAFTVTEDGLAVGLAATPVAVSGATVTLTLAGAVETGRTVKVSYTAPSMNPLQDSDGNDVASFRSESATNNTPAAPLPSIPAGALVSNVGQTNATARATFNTDLAQAFTTGAHAGGYTLSRVDIQIQHVSTTAPDYAVEIWEANTATPPLPGTRLGTLENPGTLPTASNALATFTAPAGLALKQSTTYFVVLDVGTASHDTRLPLTTSDDEDTGAATGWSIADTSRQRTSDDTGNVAASWTEVAGSAVWKIAVHATTRSSLMFQSATVNGTTLTLTFDRALAESSVPAASAFGVTVNGAAHPVSTVSIAAATVTLTLASAVTAGQTVTVRYSAPATSPLQDSAGHEVASFGAQPVTNTTPSGGGGGGGSPPSNGGNPGSGNRGGSQPRDDHGNSPAQATVLAFRAASPFRASAAGRLDTATDSDYFTLTLPRAGVFVVETNGATAIQGTVWQAGQVLARADSGGPGQNFRIATRAAAGPVVVAVRGLGRQIGRYRVQARLLVGYLENPGAASFQSGIGLLSGWVCEAGAVTIEIEQEDGTVVELAAAYGTERADTAAICGDINNGFGLLFNWNLLSDGEHAVVVLVDGVELGRATVTVTTLGEEFLRGAAAECGVADFPSAGETVALTWQESRQNFVLADTQAPLWSNRTGVAGMGMLENPRPNSFQSGIGVISGWVCDAEAVTLEITPAGGEMVELTAAYGTERGDTLAECGDTDNGFGLLFNWNLLGEGEHEVVAVVDGEDLGWAVVRVTTLGEEFVRGAAGTCEVADFPTAGETVTLEWQESQQNFVITGVD